MNAAGRLEVGVVVGCHGVRGGVRIKLHDPASRALVSGRAVVLCDAQQQQHGHTVESVAPVPGKPGLWRVQLRDVQDRDAADALVGLRVEVERAALPQPDADEFYLADAMGLPVRRRRGEIVDELGSVVGLTSNGAQDLFEIGYRARDGRRRTWLLPVLPGFVVDVTRDAVWVDPPLGLVPDELDATAEPQA
ncbi:MAG: ribosome maturation factor RimM [Nannocystaceae bacterium]|nr:ribosome maturation factor RimM [Nannocystaceae bacterium]